MKAKESTVKWFAKQEEGVWVAVCLDFCLATQGDSFEEAKLKLEEQIVFFVEEALQDKEFGSQLLNRKAPLSSWIEYYFIKLSQMIFKNAGCIFNEPMPLRPA